MNLIVLMDTSLSAATYTSLQSSTIYLSQDIWLWLSDQLKLTVKCFKKVAVFLLLRGTVTKILQMRSTPICQR